MITFKLYENPLKEENNPKWICLVTQEKKTHMVSHDTQSGALESALALLTCAAIAET